MERTSCKWITIVGILCIWTVKWVVRPYFHFNAVITFLLGITPNLLGSALLLTGAVWIFTRYIYAGESLMLRWFCMVCFLLLVINEYLQLIPFFGRTFDYYDILASALGLYISYIFIGKYVLGKRRRTESSFTNGDVFKTG